jgi:hypothetical protein
MRERMTEIEATNDRAAMREQIELLVPRIVIHTEVLGPENSRPRKRATARMQLAYGEKTAVVSTSNTSGGEYSTLLAVGKLQPGRGSMLRDSHRRDCQLG